MPLLSQTFMAFMAVTVLALVNFSSQVKAAGPVVGAPAPLFSGVDVDGKTRNLKDFQGQTVVLEWTNHECPYVRKHYESGNMPALQQYATEKGAIWLSIVSSAPGAQGHTTPEQARAVMIEQGSHETTRLLDSSGEIGRLYEAKTTPHMFVIDATGTLVYAGAIDDMATTRADSVAKAHNYVRAALEDLEANRPVAVNQTAPYGCGVKYGG